MRLFFVLTCWSLGFAESGIVLGVDNYCLLLASAVFVTDEILESFKGSRL